MNARANWLLIAMAFQQLNNEEKAREYLNYAKHDPVGFVHPHESLSFMILMKEAKELIESSPEKKS